MSPMAGGIVSIVGGILILASLLLHALERGWLFLMKVFLGLEGLPGLMAGPSEETLLLLGVAFAAVIVIGGFMLLGGRSLSGGSIVLTFAVLGLLVGGGLGAGFFLAIIGGILGLFSRPKRVGSEGESGKPL